MYELHQSAEAEMRPARRKKKREKKKQSTFHIPNMQMCWFMLNSCVCITLVGAVCESFSAPLVYRLQNTPSSGMCYFKRRTQSRRVNTPSFGAFGDAALIFKLPPAQMCRKLCNLMQEPGGGWIAG